MTEIITRFAPSPTGSLHVGGARTALFSYLYAKHCNGKFILRIEDTDLERSTEESTQAILDGMAWLGFKPDEGPYYQTERFDIYNAEIDRLVTEGKAYPCFCSTEDLQIKRDAAQAQKLKYRYDRTCHDLAPDVVKTKLSEKTPHVIRFLSTNEGSVVIDDKIKGRIEFSADELDDLIIRRTDGSPTYNFTVVVDDAQMGITHVIRGDDHVNNTPRQIQLYEALGFKVPVFAHVPMILGSDKKRLSKRHGATSVMAYKDMGYLPHALLNYLVKLGWGHGDQEIFSMEEMIKVFDLDGCNSAPSVFNTEKLDWLNAHYIKQSKPQDLAPLVAVFLEEMGAQNINHHLLVTAIGLSLEKAKTLKEMAQYLDFLFLTNTDEAETLQKTIDTEAKTILAKFIQQFSEAQEINDTTIHAIFDNIMQDTGLKMGKVANPIRVALSGKKASPGATDLIKLLGKDQILTRLQNRIQNN